MRAKQYGRRRRVNTEGWGERLNPVEPIRQPHSGDYGPYRAKRPRRGKGRKREYTFTAINVNKVDNG